MMEGLAESSGSGRAEPGLAPPNRVELGSVLGAGLLERGHALAAVDDLLASANRGEGRLLVVTGLPGTGKTALLETASLWARAAGFRSLAVKGTPIERDMPFQYLESLLDQTRREPFGLPARTGGGWHAPEEVDPGAGRPFDTDEMVRMALQRRCQMLSRARRRFAGFLNEGPALVLLDDIHWADPESAAVIAALARRAAGAPMAAIAALRPWPDEPGRLLRELVEDGLADHVELQSLSSPAARALLDRLLGRPAGDEQAARVWSVTLGNPMMVVQAARSVVMDGELPGIRSGTAQSCGLARAILLRQLVGLPVEALKVARAVAVAGHRVPLVVAQAVSGLGDEDFAAGTDVLHKAGVLRDDTADDRLEYEHDLLAESVRADTGSATRRLLHRRAFDILARLGEIEAAVFHATAARMVGEPAVLDLFAAAGRRALETGSLHSALRLLGAAVELSGPAPPAELLQQQAQALFLAGRCTEASDIWRRLLGRAEPEMDRAALVISAIQAQAYTGDLEGALAGYDALFADLGGDGPIPAALALERSHVAWELHGPTAALAALDVDVIGPDGSAEASQMEIQRLQYRIHAGDVSDLERLRRMADAVRQRLRWGELVEGSELGVLLGFASVSGALESVDVGLQIAEEGLSRLENAGVAWVSNGLRIVKGGILLGTGHPVEALAALDAVAGSDTMAPLPGQYVRVIRAEALATLGRHADAAAALGEPDSRGWPWMVRMRAAAVRAAALRVAGDLAGAADCYEEAAAVSRRVEPVLPRMAPWAAGAVDTWLAAGRSDRVSDVVERLSSAPPGQRWAEMVSLGARAGLAATAGCDVEAEDFYQRALAVPVINRLDHAALQVRFGTWLRQRRRPVAGRRPLAEAAAVAEAAGAADLASRARAELAVAGGRRRSAGTGPNGLSAQQRRVAELAASGASAREIAEALHLSARTVESHLGAVYQKLGVRSRAELRRRRWDRPGTEDPGAPGGVRV